MHFESEYIGRNSAFYSPELISENMKVESFFEPGDIIVYQAMMDSMCATYQAVACGDMRIAMEGLGDMAKSAWEFFKSIIKKIVNFIKNTFSYLSSYLMSFEKWIEKNKDNLGKFKDFEVQGYNYTIDSTPIPDKGIKKIVDGYNGNIQKIKEMELNDVQKLIATEISKDNMSALRGEISGLGGTIRSDKFEENMKKVFRDKKSSTSTIKVDSALVSTYISNFKSFKDLLQDVEEDGRNVESLLNQLADFFKGMPTYEYQSSDNKKIKLYRLEGDAKSGDLKTSENGEENYDNDYYKKLTAYYNFLFRQSKDIAQIYTKAYTVKVESLKEAISFYKDIIRRALSPFNKKDESSSKSSATKEAMGYNSSDSKQRLSHAERNEALEEFKKFSHRGWIFGTVNLDMIGGQTNVIGSVGMGGLGFTESEFRKDAREAAIKASTKSKKYRFRITSKFASALGPFGTGLAGIAILAFRKKDKKADVEDDNMMVESLNVPISTDYSLKAMEAMHEAEIDVYFETFRNYINEIDVLAEAYHSGMVMLEDVEISDNPTENGDSDSFFRKIINFIKTLINKFLDAAKDLFNSNKEWFEKNKYKFDSLGDDAYKRLKITIIQYEKAHLPYKMPKANKEPEKVQLETGKESFQKVAEIMYPQICKLSMSKDLVEGSKIYFRGGSNNIVKYEGDKASGLVHTMLEYCGNYVDHCNEIKNEIDSVTNGLEKADEELQKVQSSESYSLAEGDVVQETGLAWIPWYDKTGEPVTIMKEGTESTIGKTKTADASGNTVDSKQNGTVGDGNDTVSSNKNPSEEEKKKQEEAAKKEKEKKVGVAKGIKFGHQCKVKVATAMLTIAEERYVAYIKTLKSVLSTAKVTNDTKNPKEAS